MKKWFLFLGISITSSIYGAYIDTGFIEWEQPNGLTFIARQWGDEFLNWMETEDGYRIVKGPDRYYYYAILDANGEFVASNQKVGIDPPLADSYQLERSASRMSEIEAEIEAFNEQIALNAEWYTQKRQEAGENPVGIRLGVILVDFTPSERHRPPNFPGGYQIADFDSMVFSTDYWIGDITTNPPTPHPQAHALFGSFRDYFYQQSRGKLILEGKDGGAEIVNNHHPHPDSLLLPDWIVLGMDKAHYDTMEAQFIGDVHDSLQAKGYDISQYKRLVYIAAGGLGSDTFWPHAWGTYYVRIGFSFGALVI